MSPFRMTLAAAVLGGILAFSQPVSAQDLYYYGNTTTTVTLLPAPNYVVYSPNYLAWRSAGYYGGNWGLYYYNPQSLYPYTAGNAIWPNRIPAYPIPTPPQPYMVYYMR